MGDFFVVVNYLILGPPHPGVVMNYETPLPFFVNICQHLPSPYPLFGRRLICKRSLKLAVRPLKDLYVYDNSLKTKYDILQFVSYNIIAKIL